ncbi:MAG TPA: DUF3426 domain-containing protein [Rhodoblastus sp.]|nr:DUF3426 domain-containing protein [Rhodoblastus sp.]
MRSVPHFAPIEDRAFVFASAQEASAHQGGVSGRRAAFRPPAPPAVAPRSRLPGPWAWVLAGFIGWGVAIGARAQIVRFIPAAQPFYAALGLDATPRRMKIEHVVSRLADEDGRPILLVEGVIRNLAAAPRPAPRMRLAVLDADSQEIYHWTAAPPKARVAAGETMEFRARLAAPPKEGREVRVRFADAAGSAR